MKQLTLTQRTVTAQRLDMRDLTPERLATQSLDEIAQLPIHAGNKIHRLDELFDVSGEPCEHLRIHSMGSNLDFIGAGMTSGELTLDGDAGDGTGQGMAGGILTVKGNTGDEAGTGMSGGRLVIEGDTGERLGGPSTGSTQGMNRGLIVVRGRAGDRVGERMRRGMILIQGDAGSYCGVGLIAGTIVVQGHVGPMAGSGMRRGTILLSHQPDGLPVTFNDNGVQELSFLGLLLSELGNLTKLNAWNPEQGLYARRFLGDLSDGGMGEILWPNLNPPPAPPESHKRHRPPDGFRKRHGRGTPTRQP